MMEEIIAYAERAKHQALGRGVPEPDLPFLRIPKAGPATICVLVHGSTATPRQMTWIAERLVDGGHAVLALLLPGHGLGREPLVRTTPRDCLEELDSAVTASRAAGLTPILVGYSFGAVLSLWEAAIRDVAGVVSLAGGCKPRIPLHGWLALPFPRVVSRLPGVGEPSRAIAWKLRVARFARALRPRTGRITAPLLMWHSLRDRTMRLSGSAVVLRTAASTYKQLLVTDGPGHPLSPCPELEEVAEAVLRFVGRDHVPRDLVLKTRRPRARLVEITGSFSSWERITMRRGTDGVWMARLRVLPGQYEYAFVVDGTWQTDDAAPSGTPWPDGRGTSSVEVA